MPLDLTGLGDVAGELVVGDDTDELVVDGVLDDLDEDEPHPANMIAAETINASPAAGTRGPISNPPIESRAVLCGRGRLTWPQCGRADSS